MSGAGPSAREARALGYRSAGEVAELLGITNRTLHHYEDEGVISPVRTDGGTRFYPELEIRRAEACSSLVRLGFPVRVAYELVVAGRSAATGDDLARDVGRLLDGLRDRVRGRIGELRRLDDDLATTRHRLAGCVGCTRPPSSCPACAVRSDVAVTMVSALVAPAPSTTAAGPADRSTTTQHEVS